MSSLFQDKHSFNDDISRWDVSKVGDMQKMFYGASTFNQDLCRWGQHQSFPYGGGSTNMFMYSGCTFQDTPDLASKGPFCLSICSGGTITVQAESYSNSFGVVPEDTSDVGGGQNVGFLHTGDWMSYPAVTIPTTGTYTVSYRVVGGPGSLQFERAGGTQVFGMVVIPWTGGLQNW